MTIEKFIEDSKGLDLYTKEGQFEVINKNIDNIYHMKDFLLPEVGEYYVKKSYIGVLRAIKHPNRELQKYALERCAINLLNEIDKDLLYEHIRQHPSRISSVKYELIDNELRWIALINSNPETGANNIFPFLFRADTIDLEMVIYASFKYTKNMKLVVSYSKDLMYSLCKYPSILNKFSEAYLEIFFKYHAHYFKDKMEYFNDTTKRLLMEVLL